MSLLSRPRVLGFGDEYILTHTREGTSCTPIAGSLTTPSVTVNRPTGFKQSAT